MKSGKKGGQSEFKLEESVASRPFGCVLFYFILFCFCVFLSFFLLLFLCSFVVFVCVLLFFVCVLVMHVGRGRVGDKLVRITKYRRHRS